MPNSVHNPPNQSTPDGEDHDRPDSLPLSAAVELEWARRLLRRWQAFMAQIGGPVPVELLDDETWAALCIEARRLPAQTARYLRRRPERNRGNA